MLMDVLTIFLCDSACPIEDKHTGGDDYDDDDEGALDYTRDDDGSVHPVITFTILCSVSPGEVLARPGDAKRLVAAPDILSRKRQIAVTHIPDDLRTTLIRMGKILLWSVTQTEATIAVRSRRETILCVLPTGGGKFLLFQAPTLTGNPSQGNNKAGSIYLYMLNRAAWLMRYYPKQV